MLLLSKKSFCELSTHRRGYVEENLGMRSFVRSFVGWFVRSLRLRQKPTGYLILLAAETDGFAKVFAVFAKFLDNGIAKKFFEIEFEALRSIPSKFRPNRSYPRDFSAV